MKLPALPLLAVSGASPLAERLPREADQDLLDLFEHAALGILRITAEGRPLLANAEAARIFGYPSPEALLRELPDVRDVFVVPGGKERLTQRLLGQTGPRAEDVLLLLPDDSRLWVQLSATPRRDAAGLVHGADLFLADVTERKRNEDALRQASLVVELSPVLLMTWEMEEGWPLVYVSRNITQCGYSAKALMTGRVHLASLLHPDDMQAMLQEVRAHRLEEPPRFAMECRLKTSSGEVRWMEARVTVLAPKPGLPARCQAIFLDITGRKHADERTLQQKAYFQQLFEKSPQAIVICDAEGKVTGANKAFETMFGYTFEEIWNQRLGPFIVPAGLAGQSEEMSRRLAAGEHVEGESIRRRKDGQIVHVYLLSFPIVIDGVSRGAYRIFLDITERKRAEEQLVYHSFHDKLTGLPNRALLLDRLRRAMERARRRGQAQFALLFVDLDRFKMVNDSLGHAAGDQLIQIMARRIAAIMQPIDTVSRLGGDEFGILLDNVSSMEEAMEAARRILNTVQDPVTLLGRDLQFTASIGLTMGDLQAESEEMVLRDADIAMSWAKDNGKNMLVVFDESMRNRAQVAMQLEEELRRAIAQGEIIAHYQPVYALADLRLMGFEALARWRHPRRGLIYPGEFIQRAEETGLIVPLGRTILHQALRDMAHWRRATPWAEGLTMAVNLSARQFMQADLIGQVAEVLRESGLPPERLCLELTESVVMENAASARVLLERLKALQVSLSIDDFGTGYSSLAYLHQFPLDTLKVDRSFVQRLGQGEEHDAIVRAIVQLATNLRMRVVAEGVEEPCQLERLQAVGCTAAQGYLLGRPMPAEEALRRIESGE